MRDVFDHPNQAGPAKEAAELEKAELEKLKAWSAKLDKDGEFTDLVRAPPRDCEHCQHCRNAVQK